MPRGIERLWDWRPWANRRDRIGVLASSRTLLHPATGLVIGLVEHEPSEANAFSEARVGLDHLAFSVPSRSELEAWVEHFDGHGVDHSGINDQSYGSVVVFRDPDNVQLELFVFNAG